MMDDHQDGSGGRDDRSASIVVSSDDEHASSKEAAGDQQVDRRMGELTRRAFVVGAVAAAAGFGGWKWLDSRPRIDQTPWPFRRTLEANERISRFLFSQKRLSPDFPVSQAASNVRVNGLIGLDRKADVSNWKIRIEGSGTESFDIGIDEIRSMKKYEMATELRCIEGWSLIAHWSGARLADLMARYPPRNRDGSAGDLRNPSRLVRYVSMETPNRSYYIGLDLESALHPQTLLAYEINNGPLSWDHGSPVRLAIPVKYGIKNIKRIATIRYTDIRPADFWGERGYDWYAGH